MAEAIHTTSVPGLSAGGPDVIVQIGQDMGRLFGIILETEHAFDRAKSGSAEEAMLESKSRRHWGRYHALNDSLTVLRTTSLEGALIQLRSIIPVLDYLEDCGSRGHTGAERITRLLYSAIPAIEEHLGVSRSDYGGLAVMPDYLDPFDGGQGHG